MNALIVSRRSWVGRDRFSLYVQSSFLQRFNKSINLDLLQKQI